MTLNEWLRKNNACASGFQWAISTCKTLEDVWNTAKPDWLIWVATREGVLSDRELWLFACHCAEQALPNWYKFAPDDHRPRIAIETRHKWLDGAATDEDLSAAESAAWSAAWSAAASAWSAAWSAAASAAAWSAAASAARSAESALAKWLRANTKPNFAGVGE